MTPVEIEELIIRHEYWTAKHNEDDNAEAAKLHDDTVSALRFLLKEREDLVQATAAKDLPPNGQLHASSPKEGVWLHRRDSPYPFQTWRTFAPGDFVEIANYHGDVRSGYAHEFWWGYEEECGELAEGVITRARRIAPPQRQGDRPELPNDLRSRETKTSGENP